MSCRARLASVAFIGGVSFLVAQVPDSGTQAHRNRGKAYYEHGEYALAAQEFLKVLEPGSGAARDHFNAAMALLQNGDYDRALTAFHTARQMDPKMIDVEFGLGILFKREQRFREALASFERVVAVDPEDPCTWFNLGAVHFSIGNAAEARKAFDRVLAAGFDVARNFYVSALFRKATLLSRENLNAEAQKLFAEFQARREDVPGVSLTPQALENGRYATVEILIPSAATPVVPLRAARFRLVGDRRFSDRPCGTQAGEAKPSVVLGDYDADGRIDVFVTSPCGKSRLFRNAGGGRWVDVTSEAGLEASTAATGALFIDHDNSGWPSLLVWSEKRNRFFVNRKGTFAEASAASGLGKEVAAPGAVALSLDFDADGQLDLFVSGARDSRGSVGPRLYRNNGDGSFRDVTDESGIASVASLVRAAALADLDGDGLMDLVLGLGSGVHVVRNVGGRKFQVLPALVPDRRGTGAVARIHVFDCNQDGWLDVFVAAEARSMLFENVGEGNLTAASGFPQVTAHRDGFALALDANTDGGSDLLFRDDSGHVRLLAYRGGTGLAETQVEWPREATGEAAWADLEGNGNVDVVTADTDGVLRMARATPPSGERWIGISLTGEKANRQAVGALVELKAGDFYRKFLYRGLPLVAYAGPRARLDVVRVTWTSGVIQNEMDVPTDRATQIIESDRQTSSCPFLYVWDGSAFRFLTDVSGRAPLGEPLPDGGDVEPYPEDYVRIPPGRLQARDGRYLVQITEELREIAYVDAIELIAVDHPEGGEIYTNEKFSPPPVKPFRVHRVTEKHTPVNATNHRDEDVRALIAEADGHYVSGLALHRIGGIAEEHAIVLEPGDLSAAGSVKLFLTGWVYWVSSSGMRALSTRGDLTLKPPSLQVKDRRGRWVTVVENIGLPSGIDRTLVVDLTGKFLSEIHSVRIATNLRVYWDRAFFSLGTGSIEGTLHLLSPFAAELHYRGFSFPVLDETGSRPDFFDYSRPLEEAPWNAASGFYTRFGDVLPRLASADDDLVIMAPGDELTLVFDGESLPPVQTGHRRDFILHVTGWAKDNEPNTAASQTVEPLPFHGMGRYANSMKGGVHDGNGTRRVPSLVPPLAPVLPREY